MRTPRVIVPQTVHHVISRFVDRDWFLKDEYERSRYLELLGKALVSSDWLCLAYALMSNHLHLALIAGETAPGAWLKKTHSPFATWMNQRHERLGPLFADRPAMWTVRPVNEGMLIAYIHNNPVRAGIVKTASESTWTSHRAYLGLVAPPSWLAVDQGLERSGFAGEPMAFDSWVAGSHEEIQTPNLSGIHRAARRRGALEIGVAPIEADAAVPIVARPFAHVRPDPGHVIDVVASVCGVDRFVVCSRSTVSRAVAARRIAVYCGRDLGVSLTDIGTALGISRQGASRLGLQALEGGERGILDVVRNRVLSETYDAIRDASLVRMDTVPSRAV